MAKKGRSPTAKRVWLWLDASAPREARTLAVLDRMQETLPPRVRATLLREAFCAALEQVAAELDENAALPQPKRPPEQVVRDEPSLEPIPDKAEAGPSEDQVEVGPLIPGGSTDQVESQPAPESRDQAGTAGLMW